MSSTSSSWRSGPAAGAAALGRARGDIGLLACVAVVHGQAVAPPQLARDAPGPDLLHPVEVDAAPSARGRSARAVAHRVGSRALASSSMRMNHCSEISGSMRSPSGASRGPRACSGSLAASRPSARSAATHRRRASSTVSPAKRCPPRRSCARPRRSPRCSEVVAAADLEVVGVVAGVIFSAPVPKSGFTYSSAMIGSRRPTSGKIACARRAPRSARRPGSRPRRCRPASSPAARWRP